MGPAIDYIDSEDSQDEEAIEAAKKSPLMQQINQTSLKVTGKVVGIIKKFPKTYGGSILNMDQMQPSTTAKLVQFAEANNLANSEIEKYYRVFVPYNN